MAIDEQQAEPAAAPERKHHAEQNRAVASENQCEFTTVQHLCGRVRELALHCAMERALRVPVSASRSRLYDGGSTRPAWRASRRSARPFSSDALGSRSTLVGLRPRIDGASIIAKRRGIWFRPPF